MSLTILDTIIDEEIRTPSTAPNEEQEVAALTGTFATAVGALPLNLLASPTGFPQFAERTNFVSSTNSVTNYFLTSSATGTPFPAGGTATTLYVGSNQIFLFATTDPNIVVGRVGNGTTANPAGAVALIIGVEETLSGGVVTSADMWLVLRAPLVQDGQNLVDSADQLDLTGLVYLGSDYATATEVPFSDFSTVPSGNNLFNVIFPTGAGTDLQLLLTGSEGETLGTINVSTTGIGANAQHVENGATLRIDTVSGMIQGNVNSAPEVNNSANIDYTARVNLSAANFQLTQVNPGSPNARADLTIFAFDAAGASQEAAYLTNAIATDGTPVQIDAADVKILNAAGADVTAAFLAGGGTITQNGDGVTIRGLADDARVAFSTDGIVFDRFLITNVDSKETFDIGNINVTTLVGGSSTEYADLGAHLIMQDDGPNIDASGATLPSVTTNDSDFATNSSASYAALFNAPDYGADGAGSLSYILAVKSNNVASGLVDTVSGQNVVLSYDSATNTVFGKTATSGVEVFRITVASNGTVTLDQSRAVQHTDSNVFDTSISLSAADLITLTAKVVDSEAANQNDSDTAVVNIGQTFNFVDDGPAITPQAGGSATPNNLVIGNMNGATDTSSYGLDGGGDGQKSFGFINPDSTGDFQWNYFDFDGGGAGTYEIKGTYKGADLYKVILDPATGAYTMTMIGELPSSTLNLNTKEIKAGGPDTNSIEVGAIENAQFVRITGDSTGGAGNINESNAFVGVDNGNLDAGETLSFTLHEANGSQINFSGISIGTKSAQASTYHVVAHLVGGGIYEADIAIGKNGTLIVDPPGNVLVSSIDVTKLTGSATKIGLGDIDILIPPNDVTLSFDVRLTDGDNDFVGATFTASIDGNNDGSITNPIQGLAALNTSYDTASMLDSTSVFGMKHEALTYPHHSDYYFA